MDVEEGGAVCTCFGTGKTGENVKKPAALGPFVKGAKAAAPAADNSKGEFFGVKYQTEKSSAKICCGCPSSGNAGERAANQMESWNFLRASGDESRKLSTK